MFSSSGLWDPPVLDNELSDNPNWFDIVKNDTKDGHLRMSPFNAQGNYAYRYPNKKPRPQHLKAQLSKTRSLPSLDKDHDHDSDSSIDSTDVFKINLTV